MAASNGLPHDARSWQRLADSHSLSNASIHTHQDQKSGSNIGMEQFLLLRAVWPKRRLSADFKKDCEKAGWVSRRTLDLARKHLKGLESWSSYEESFKSNNNKTKTQPLPQGTFALVHYYQKLSSTERKEVPYTSQPKVEFSPRVTRSQTAALREQHGRPETPTRGPKAPGSSGEIHDATDLLEELDLGLDPLSGGVPFSSPLGPLSHFSPVTGDTANQYQAIEDEQIVNTALILFLNALTLHCDSVSGEWTLHRRPFVVRDLQRVKVYEARVDGLLRANRDGRPGAIIEVKPFLHHVDPKIREQICRQETAQMTAWIAQHPPVVRRSNPYRRLLVSQDRHEIYLTVATFDAHYVGYIRGNKGNTSFLRMQEYGPFPVNDIDSMKQLGVILLSISVQGGID